MNINPKHIISLTEARKRFFDIANEVQKPDGHYVLTEKGSPKVVIMSVEEFESWQETIEVYRQFPNIEQDVKKAHEEYLRGETYSMEEVFAEQEIAVADGKAKKYVPRTNIKKRKKRSS